MNKNIFVKFDEEKQKALRHFLSLKKLDLEAELESFCTVLYKKHVPTNVRDYLELRDSATPEKPLKKAAEPPKTPS